MSSKDDVKTLLNGVLAQLEDEPVKPKKPSFAGIFFRNIILIILTLLVYAVAVNPRVGVQLLQWVEGEEQGL